MLARLCAFVIWALVAATLVFWGLRLAVRAPTAPAHALAVGDAAAARGDLTRLLGATPVASIAPTVAPVVEANSRFRLLGIAAPRPGSNRGVALIAVDGKLPRAYPVGSRIDADLVLESVSLRSASIASAKGAPAIKLEIPALAAAATGSLPSAMPGGVVMPTMPVMPGLPPVGLSVPSFGAAPASPGPVMRPLPQAVAPEPGPASTLQQPGALVPRQGPVPPLAQ